MSNSKNKGNRAERDVAKWWEQFTGYEFGRVPASGGLRWKKTDNITSDVICTDDKHSRRFPFSIEVKFYKDINFEHILLGNKKCKIREFWEQAKSDADRGNKLPILMMRYNGMPKDQYFFCVDQRISYLMRDQNGPIMYIEDSDLKLHIYMASNIKKLNYKEIYKEARRILKNK